MSVLKSRRPSVVIANLSPSVDGGKYPAKRVAGEQLRVEADIFKDGHDQVRAAVQWKQVGAKKWQEIEMQDIGNDRWIADLSFSAEGNFQFRVEAWPDDYLSWLHDFDRRVQGKQMDLSTETEEGRLLLLEVASRATTADAKKINTLAAKLSKSAGRDVAPLLEEEKAAALLAKYPNRELAAVSELTLPVVVEPSLARFSAWYEFFPRCAEGKADVHSTFKDCLPRVKDAVKMGFDVVYFPPIHPIGVSHRKGKNNTVTCEPGDVGSPWAIGADTGGHRSVEPALGTLDDFKKLVKDARGLGVEIALDFAINCSPDHPYVKDHPEWFYHRPDGTIKYAENPPKKYQDIYPLNFHCEDWAALWNELLEVVKFWIDCGVTIFRVDNPHTKPVAFWEWLIEEIHQDSPEIIFLAEAFTRPKMMQSLAKVGFTQSYTYFTWRETKLEIIEYIQELTRGEMRDYYRANFWPNTPDILPYHLQNAPPAMFKIRAALAATLSSTWGMYSGYELCENKPLEGREEYLDSEKYQLKERNWDQAGNIKAFISRLNEIRRSEPAFQEYANIEFIPADNDQVLAFYKWTDDRSNIIVVVVNLDGLIRQETNIHLPLDQLGLSHDDRFAVEDLMFEEIYHWQGSSNFVSLDPRSKPLHILKIAR